ERLQEVHGDAIPHHEAIAPLRQQGFCSGGEESIRRADVSRRKSASLRDEVLRYPQLVFQRVWLFKWKREVAMTVDSETVSLCMDSLHEMLVLFNLAPDQEKRGADIVLCQRLQHSRRVARVRTVVEGEGELAAGRVAAPKG